MFCQSEHAGVPPYPGTESGDLSRERTSPEPPPGYDVDICIPVIVIDGDS
jgi:hypothetical protein